MGLVLLYGLQEGKLWRREFPAGWGSTVIAVGRRFLEDAIELQVGQVPQVCLTDAVVAHDAERLRS